MKRNLKYPIICNIFNDNDIKTLHESRQCNGDNCCNSSDNCLEDDEFDKLFNDFDNILDECDSSDNCEETEKVDHLLDAADDEFDELNKIFDELDDDTDNDENDNISEMSLFEDDEDNTTASEQNTMTDEELKDESLKIAINVAKLMTNVQANDIITIAGTIADFIRNHEIGEEDFENLSPAENDDEESTDDTDLFNDNDFENSDAENENIMDVDSDDDLNNPFV